MTGAFPYAATPYSGEAEASIISALSLQEKTVVLTARGVVVVASISELVKVGMAPSSSSVRKTNGL